MSIGCCDSVGSYYYDVGFIFMWLFLFIYVIPPFGQANETASEWDGQCQDDYLEAVPLDQGTSESTSRRNDNTSVHSAPSSPLGTEWCPYQDYFASLYFQKEDGKMFFANTPLGTEWSEVYSSNTPLGTEWSEVYSSNTPLGTEWSPLPGFAPDPTRVRRMRCFSMFFAYSTAIEEEEHATKWYHSVPSGTTRYRVEPFSREYQGRRVPTNQRDIFASTPINMRAGVHFRDLKLFVRYCCLRARTWPKHTKWTKAYRVDQSLPSRAKHIEL